MPAVTHSAVTHVPARGRCWSLPGSRRVKELGEPERALQTLPFPGSGRAEDAGPRHQRTSAARHTPARPASRPPGPPFRAPSSTSLSFSATVQPFTRAIARSLLHVGIASDLYLDKMKHTLAMLALASSVVVAHTDRYSSLSVKVADAVAPSSQDCNKTLENMQVRRSSSHCKKPLSRTN